MKRRPMDRVDHDRDRQSPACRAAEYAGLRAMRVDDLRPKTP